MRRLHLVEIHEQPWCPRAIRDGITDFMQAAIRGMGIFRPMVPILGEALMRTGDARIVDLCSGGTGPWLALRPELEAHTGHDVSVVMTDLFPSQTGRDRVADLHDDRIAYLDASIDARKVRPDLQGFRTVFDAFHQFDEEMAVEILGDAVANAQGIAVFEILERRWVQIVMASGLPGIVPVMTPFFRPFRWSRLFWTYVVPVLPFVVAFDAVVSCLRTYETDEIDRIVRRVDAPGYTWEVGKVKVPWLPMHLTYLVGLPPHAASAAGTAEAVA